MWNKRSGIMLANPFSEKRFNKWGGVAIIQPKLNGERCRAEITNGKVRLVSSELNEFTMLPHIGPELIRLGFDNIELDGELYIHGMELPEIHSIVSRTVEPHPNYEQMEFHVFDIVVGETQIERTDMLEELPTNETIKTVPSKIISSYNEVYDYLQYVRSYNYEGIIARALHAPYIRKRSPFMMKWKPTRRDSYIIVDYREEISKNGTPKGRLGSLGFVGADDSIGWVGSGFDHAQRKELWERRYELIGKTVVVDYQHLTAKRGVPVSSVFVALE